MRTPLVITAVVIALTFVGCGATGQAAADSTPVRAASTQRSDPARNPAVAPLEIVSAQFGVFGADPTGRRYLFETDRFPAVVAAPFGWYIVFKTDRPTVIWREEFELPAAPPTWGMGEAIGAYAISPDRRTAVTERIIPARLGFVANEWRYAPGDPIGRHKIRVFIDGQLVREFAFAIEREAPSESEPQLPPGHPPVPRTSI